MPHSHSDPDLSGERCKTVNGENFVLADNGLDNKIVIFGTENSLRHLAEADTFFMDEAFSVCPSLFYQLFTSTS